MDSDKRPISSYKRSFINYFSLGYDARVGFGFEKKRSNSRTCNKCIYFWEGCKKNCCRKTIPLNSFFDSFHVIDIKNENIEKEMNTMKSLKIEKTAEIKLGNKLLEENEENDKLKEIKKPDENEDSSEQIKEDNIVYDSDIFFDNLMKRNSKVCFKARTSFELTRMELQNCKQ